MGKQSALGPIDPQITMISPEGPTTLPAQAILDEFAMAKREILSDPRLAAVWIPKLQRLPHGFLKYCETTIELAKQKVAGWLNDYMLHDPATSITVLSKVLPFSLFSAILRKYGLERSAVGAKREATP
jgi:hypothetical protein